MVPVKHRQTRITIESLTVQSVFGALGAKASFKSRDPGSKAREFLVLIPDILVPKPVILVSKPDVIVLKPKLLVPNLDRRVYHTFSLSACCEIFPLFK